MIKRIFIAALALAALTCWAPPHTDAAKARAPKLGPVGITVHVVNHSSTCVWVSVAWAHFAMPWSWMNEWYNKARFIHPGTSYSFIQGGVSYLPMPHPWEVKVEGTFMKNADCTGGHARPAITRYNKGLIATDLGTKVYALSTLSGTGVDTYDVETPHDPGH